MLFLYLDESGDLGFDFVNKKPSKFFTITILALEGIITNRRLLNAVMKTIKRKLNPKKKAKSQAVELKATKTIFSIKEYFYKLIKDMDFSLYSLSLNKRRVYEDLAKNKERVYNYIARLVLDKIPLSDVDRILLIVDKSKGAPEINEFNKYIRRQLEARLNPKVPLDIYHYLSHENGGLQAVDLFSWGIFQKYERNKTDWFNLFKDKIKYDAKYL